VKETFLAGGGRKLPQVTYPAFEPTPSIKAVRKARRRVLPVMTIDLWLDRQAQSIELGARMPAAAGPPSFFEYGRQAYGEPAASLPYVPLTPLELAQNILDTIEQLARIDIQIAPPAYHSAEQGAEDLGRAVRAHFGERAPAIELVDQLSANALATSRSIRIRRGSPRREGPRYGRKRTPGPVAARSVPRMWAGRLPGLSPRRTPSVL
jgi:hypothetical protein